MRKIYEHVLLERRSSRPYPRNLLQQATGGADEFGDDSEAAHAVASSKIRDAKRVYRSAFEARKQAQMELVHVDARRKYLFRLLVAKFQAAHDLVST